MVFRPELPTRDQDTTGFTRILDNLVEAVQGVLGAALVDDQGECVDYSGALRAYEIRLVAAHAQIELRNASYKLSETCGTVRSITIYARKQTIYAARIVEDYSLILIFMGANPPYVSHRALAQAEFDICREGGWPTTPITERWIHLSVESSPDGRSRPCRIQLESLWYDVDVIGIVVGLSPGERGFRVRTRQGAEMTLVRERHGRWYADARY